MPAAGVDDEHGGEHRQQVGERRRVDVGAGRHADHAGQPAGDRPERVAAAREVAAGEAAGEAHGDHHRDRAERRRAEVDGRPARERGRRDHQAGAVEGVEAGEDQHQPQRGDVQVVRSERARAARRSCTCPMRGPRLKSTPSVKAPATPCTTPDAIESWKPKRSVSQPPALQPQAASRIHTTEPRQDGEHQVGRDAHPLDERAGHDRGRRPREEQEGQEEDQVDVVREVRPEGVAPRDRRARRRRR